MLNTFQCNCVWVYRHDIPRDDSYIVLSSYSDYSGMVMGPRCSSFRKTESRATLNKEEPSKPPDHEVHDRDTSPVITVKVDSCPTHSTGRVVDDPFANDCNRYRSKAYRHVRTIPTQSLTDSPIIGG